MHNLLGLLVQITPGIPPDGGWLGPAVLVLLGTAAFIDARTGRVPDPIILGGLFLTTAAQGFFVDWPFAGQHLAIGLFSGFALYLVNEIWYRVMKHDAFGMGDAKWTVLAVSCFDVMPAMFAWVIGACCALIWMGTLRISHRKIAHVHFAPFLFVGLCAGLYWLRLR